MTIPGLGMLGRPQGLERIVRKITDAEDSLAQYQVAPVPLAALLRALFRTPGGTAQITTPEQYGAIGTGVADDWAALTEALSIGGIVWCDRRKVYGVSQPVVIPPGSFLVDGRTGRSLIGTTGARIQALNSFSGGDFVVEFAAGTAAVGGGISINVGGLGNIASALGGVLIPDGCYNSTIEHAWIGSLSDSAIRMTGHPVAARIRDTVGGYDVTARTLTVPTGVLEVRGSDHNIDDSVEMFGGPSHAGGPAAGYDRVSYPGLFYRCGVLFDGECHNVRFGDVVPEFCDTAWYISATGNQNRLIGSRSDYSAGPGLYVVGTDTIFVALQVNGAGFADTFDGNFYDGCLLTGGAARNRFLAYQLGSGGAPNAVRYGWRDETTGNGTQNENVLSPDHLIRPEDCLYDTVYRAEPRTAVRLGGSGPLRDRPPSRWANGQHWVDTERGIDCYSDGAAWRDAFTGISGNLATPKLAEGIGGTLQIQNADSTCTVSGVPWATAGPQGQLLPFGALAGAVCTAAGAAAGYIDVATVADGAGAFTAVTAGEDYTYTVESVAVAHAATLTMVVNYYDHANVYLGSSALLAATGGGTNSTSAVTDTYWQHVTAPAGAFFAQPVFRLSRTGMAVGEAHWLNGVAIVPDSGGVVTGYVRP